MWYVVYVNGKGGNIVSGPHGDEETATRFVSNDKEEVWPLEVCRSRGLIPSGE